MQVITPIAGPVATKIKPTYPVHVYEREDGEKYASFGVVFLDDDDNQLSARMCDMTPAQFAAWGTNVNDDEYLTTVALINFNLTAA